MSREVPATAGGPKVDAGGNPVTGAAVLSGLRVDMRDAETGRRRKGGQTYAIEASTTARNSWAFNGAPQAQGVSKCQEAGSRS